MNEKPSLAEWNAIVQSIAVSMTTVATNIAMLGVEGDADEQMRIITEENNSVLDRIRDLYNIPKLPVASKLPED
ncbi:Ras family protein [Dyella mobilis]|nr:Ras family protein [Dyella mobilis]GLQ98832.1 hypothetical protein GCM10007863_32520 [Dyella mobilis]